MRTRLAAVAAFFALWATARAARPVVAVTIPPQRWLVRELAGELVEPLVVVPADQDPHAFEPTASRLAALSKAELWLTIGLPFEATVRTRLAAISPSMKVVSIGTGLAGDDGGRDPHVWLAPSLMAALATNACAALEALLPGSKGDFRAGLARVTGKIASLDSQIRKTLSGRPGRVLWAQHPSWGHFARAYGLEQRSLERNGAEPTPRQLARLSDDAAREGVTVLFSDPRHDPRLAEIVARQIGARVVPVDPLAENWDENLLSVARKLAETDPGK